MKKNKLRKIIWTLVALLLLFSGALYYAYQQAFKVPESVVQTFRDSLKSMSGIDFESSSVRLNVANHTLKLKDFKLMVPEESPFLAADSADVYFASGTGPLDLYHSNVMVERLDLKNFVLDINSNLPKSTNKELDLNAFPVSEMNIYGLTINTSLFSIPAPNFFAKVLRSENSANLYVDFGENFIAGKLQILASLDLKSSVTRARLSWEKKDFAGFFPFMILSHYFGLTIKNGSLQLELNWTGNLKELIENGNDKKLLTVFRDEVSGGINLKDLDFNFKGVEARLKALAQRKNEAEKWLIDAKIHRDSSFVSFNGIWGSPSDDGEELVASLSIKDLNIDSKLLNILKIQNDFKSLVPGKINLSSEFSVGKNDFTIAGKANTDGWKWEDEKLKKGILDFAVDRSGIASLSAFIDTGMGKGVLKTSLSLRGSQKFKGTAQGNLYEVDVNKIGKFVSHTFTGTGVASFSLGYNLESFSETDYILETELEDCDLYGFNPQKLRLTVAGHGKDWRVLNPSAAFPCSGTVEIEGEISKEKLDGRVNVSEVNLANFGVPVRIVSGVASLKGKISGTLAEPSLDGEVWGSNIGLFGLELPVVRAQIKIKEEVLELSPLTIKASSDSFIDGFYSINLGTGKTEAFRVNFQKLPIEKLKPLLPEYFGGMDAASFIGGSISFDGRRGVESWKYLIDGYKLILREQEIDSFYLEGSLLDNQGEIKKLFARTSGGTVSFSGEFIDFDSFFGILEIDSVRLDRMPMLAKFLPEAGGEISSHGEIEWTSGKKGGNFTLFIRDFKSRGRDLGNFGCELSLDESGLQIESGEFDKLGIKFDGKMNFAGPKSYVAEIKLNNVDFSFVTEAHGIKTFEPGGLLVDGHCSIQGDLSSSIPENIDLQIDSLRIQKDNDIIVSNKPMRVIYQNGGVEVRSLELKYRLGILGFEGIVTPGKSMAIMINGKDFSLQALGRLFDLPNWPYDGSLSINARVFGDVRDLKLKANANVDGLEVFGKKIPGLWISVEGDNKKISIEEARVTLPTSSFNLKGEIDLVDYFKPDNIDIHLFIPPSPLTDIPEYFPEVIKEASGTIRADLNLTGKPFNPRIVGELSLFADQLGFSSMRKPLKNVDFAMSTKDSIINIDRLSAELGRGKLSGDGTIDFHDHLGSISARISGEKLDLSFFNLDVNNASAGFKIEGDVYNPVLNGKIFVPRGKFNLTSDIFKKKRRFDLFFDTLKYNIDIEVPRNFWIKSSFLNAEMKGEFSLNGDLETVKMDGGVKCIQGNLFFQQRRFRIETGEIKFGGVEDSFDPQIFVKSEGQIQSTKIFLTLHGRVSSFTPSIYSTPPMAESDLLAMLTLGRDPTNMMSDNKEPFEKEVLEGLKNSYISALLGQTISSALNLDELFLSSLLDRTSGKSKSFIRVGKYIGRNIFMAYEGTMQEGDEEAYIFEYRLPKGFVVDLEFKEPKKEQRIGVRYDWMFW